MLHHHRNRLLLAISLLLQSAFLFAQQKQSLSNAEKLYGLSHIWSEAKYNFVYFDKVETDWDSLYTATIPQVLEAKTTKVYYDVLRRFAARLKDGHTGVWYPGSFYQKEAAYPPIGTALVGGKVFITAVADSLAGKGWQVGQEIIKIAGFEVHSYAQQAVAPYESASTPQGLEATIYGLYLLNGPIEEPVRLTVKDKNGNTVERTLWRSTKRVEPPTVQYQLLENNIGLLTINSFSNPKFKTVFDSLYKQIQAAKALIIDLRPNTGGDGSQGEYMLKHFTTTPFPDPQISSRQYNPLLKAWGQTSPGFYTMASGKTAPFKDRPIYSKPIVVLIGKLTGSAAEDFSMQFDAIHRGALVGQPSSGSTGQPVFSTLPGGGTFRVCVRKDTYPDGKEFVGKGLQPTIPVAEDAEAFRRGEDVVMKKALEILK